MSKLTPRRWIKLDNAAKIFPASSSKQDPKVFRFSCELCEEVEEDVLQRALQDTLEEFPNFLCVLKRGLFWYYLEETPVRPLVHQEGNPPCGLIYKDSRSLLFEVTYFHRRINLEVYHALTDGTGALLFLQAMVYHYLLIKHADAFSENPPVMEYDASAFQKMDDSFDKYYAGRPKTKKNNKKKAPKAFRLNGAKNPEYRLRIIEGVMPVDLLLEKAREYDTTLTVLLTAVIMRSIYEEMNVRERKRPVVVTIPVNLRKYFSSQSARNFFSVFNVGYDFKNQSPELEEIISRVKEYFETYLNEEYLQERMNALAALEHNIFARVTPLVLKNVFMKMAHDLNRRQFTFSLSNVGKVNMPKELCPYIRLFDVFTSTSSMQACACSFENKLNFSFTSVFQSTDIPRRFFRTFVDMGIPVEVVSNHIYTGGESK